MGQGPAALAADQHQHRVDRGQLAFEFPQGAPDADRRHRRSPAQCGQRADHEVGFGSGQQRHSIARPDPPPCQLLPQRGHSGSELAVVDDDVVVAVDERRSARVVLVDDRRQVHDRSSVLPAGLPCGQASHGPGRCSSARRGRPARGDAPPRHRTGGRPQCEVSHCMMSVTDFSAIDHYDGVMTCALDAPPDDGRRHCRRFPLAQPDRRPGRQGRGRRTASRRSRHGGAGNHRPALGTATGGAVAGDATGRSGAGLDRAPDVAMGPEPGGRPQRRGVDRRSPAPGHGRDRARPTNPRHAASGRRRTGIGVSDDLRRGPPRGGRRRGRPVLVLPGMTASDRSTLPLRAHLRLLGHPVHGWGLGTNDGPHRSGASWPPCSVRRTLRSVRRAPRPGGLEPGRGLRLGPRRPTPGPRRLDHHAREPTSDLGRGRTSGRHAGHLDLVAGGMPLCPGRNSLVDTGPFRENIEVRSLHATLGVDPLVMAVVADRLGRPRSTWRPFRPPRPLARAYPRAVTVDRLEST